MYRILDIDGQDFENRKGEGDTLAGFIIEIAERIPTKFEIIEFKNFEFKIEAADSRKVSTVKVRFRALIFSMQPTRTAFKLLTCFYYYGILR